MKNMGSTGIIIGGVMIVLQCVSVYGSKTDHDLFDIVTTQNKKSGFDFFYFVLQWPGSYCDTRQSCCYPKTGKPEADFGIHGLWPNYNDGSYPSNCNPSPFDLSEITDLRSEMAVKWPSLACPSSSGTKFWSHEWTKHGTCSISVLGQHAYFKAALDLSQRAALLSALQAAGIEPNDQFYSLESIAAAIKKGTGAAPGIQCNRDIDGNSQLYQVYLCADTSASSIIECPLLPHGSGCASRIQFPSF